MSGVCVFPQNISDADRNYLQAQEIYRQKRIEISNKIKEQYNVTGEEFVSQIQQNLKQNMNEKIVSERTGQTVKMDTILKHLYKTAEEMAGNILGIHSNEISNLKQEIKQLQQDSIANGQKAQKDAENEINNLVQDYANEMQLDNLVYKYLPQFMSGDNIKLSTAQILGYVKSILKSKISTEVYGQQMGKIISQRPSIILGYIREDATADASNKAINHFNMGSAQAKTVGAEQSKVDILIALSKAAGSSMNNAKILQSILTSLDTVSDTMNFDTQGESVLETNDFLGIQAKPWKLFLPTTSWNRLSVGSRAGLLKDFTDAYNPNGVENQYAWHNGVYFLSTRLQDVLGANTVMYVTGNSILWTDELFDQIYGRKYFAFMLDKDHALTSHVQLADHTD